MEIDQRARNAEDDGDAEGLEEERSDAVTAEQAEEMISEGDPVTEPDPELVYDESHAQARSEE